MQSLIKVLVPKQLFLLLILSTGLLNHVILIPNLLTAAGRDSWICVIIMYPISFIFIWLIYFIVKNSPKEGFFSMIRNRLGKVFSTALSLPVIIFLFTSAYVTLRDLMIWLNAYFLADYSIFIITCILVTVCFLITLSGIKSMAISSGLLLPLVMIFGILIAITNTTLKDPSLLFPLFAEGLLPLFKGGIYVLSGLLEVYIVILLQPYSQERIKFKHLFILLTIITGLIFGPLSASIMEFGPIEAVNLRYPAYEQWRILSIGEYISHLDFFALFQWLSGALIRIGLFMYLLGTFFSKNKVQERLSFRIVGILYFLLFILMTIKFDTQSFYKFIYYYFLPATMIFFLFQILLSAFILLVLRKREEHYGKNNKLETSKER